MERTTKLFNLIVIAAISFALVACGGSSTSSEGSEEGKACKKSKTECNATGLDKVINDFEKALFESIELARKVEKGDMNAALRLSDGSFHQELLKLTVRLEEADAKDELTDAQRARIEEIQRKFEKESESF